MRNKMLYIIVPFCSLFIGIGLFLAIKTGTAILKGRAAQAWPKVPAEVLDVQLVENSDSEGDTYRVDVKYRYTVDGVEYEGSRIHPAYTGDSGAAHGPLYERLEQAKRVEVSYNPESPEEAYILTGAFSSNLVGVFGGLLFFFAGLMFLLVFWFGLTGKSGYADGVHVLEQKAAPVVEQQ